jgi:hypothetical protein
VRVGGRYGGKDLASVGSPSGSWGPRGARRAPGAGLAALASLARDLVYGRNNQGSVTAVTPER